MVKEFVPSEEVSFSSLVQFAVVLPKTRTMGKSNSFVVFILSKETQCKYCTDLISENSTSSTVKSSSTLLSNMFAQVTDDGLVEHYFNPLLFARGNFGSKTDRVLFQSWKQCFFKIAVEHVLYIKILLTNVEYSC